MSSESDEYEHLTVHISRDSREERNRAASGRASRFPPVGKVKELPGRAKKQKLEPESLEGFWKDVVGGKMGLTPMNIVEPAAIEENRNQAALLEGQLVTLPPDIMVSSIYICE